MSQFKCVAQTNGIRGLTHKDRLDRRRLLARNAKELADSQPDVIFAGGTAAATALREHTLSIPIVFVQVPDPVAAGFVTNLARPNGNITGFTNFEFSIGEKWLQLLNKYAPTISRVAVLFDPGNPSWAAYLRAIEAAAPSVGVQLIPVGVWNGAAEGPERVLQTFGERNEALPTQDDVSVLPAAIG
jgi:putative ABC transport system substrate-binding protein